jgi:hypothetical protein
MRHLFLIGGSSKYLRRYLWKDIDFLCGSLVGSFCLLPGYRFIWVIRTSEKKLHINLVNNIGDICYKITTENFLKI